MVMQRRGYKMTIKITNETKIKVIYFDDELALKQQKVFDGNVGAWRKDVSEDWDGFDLGDRFHIKDDKVRVFKVSENVNKSGVFNFLLYFVGPFELNPNKINYDNLVES